jgi:ATP-dependent DNA ligase
MKFPILYKKTSTGKIQEWEIYTDNNKIITIHGQREGKKQICEETIYEGKNTGRANATTPAQQAEAEAQSRWTKKHDKDYKLSIEDCQTEEKTSNAGGYLPMLAHEYKKHGNKYMKYPCYVQPKLDGIRCIATRTDKVKLWFRNGKEIITMSHIVKALDKVMKEGDIFDGELYIHGEDFNEFTGAIRANKNLNPEITDKIQYHIYDFPRIQNLKEKNNYSDRIKIFSEKLDIKQPLILVSTEIVSNFEEAIIYYKQKIEEGYEGIIFRNFNMAYEQKRSYNLLKYKEFIDDEFEIISVEEGRGKLAGHVGAFICRIEPGRILKDLGGKEFKHTEQKIVRAKMDGKVEYLEYLWKHPEECLNKFLTIKYQNLSKDGIPRFPVGKTIRFDK